jgi:hypothetical protein
VDALARHDERAKADGEVVWSRRPDAGVKLAEQSVDDGGKQARLTEESSKEAVKSIRAGNAG